MKKYPWFVWGLIAVIVGHGLDILSTVLCARYVPGAFEGNQLVRDEFGRFILGAGVEVKTISLLCALLISGLIYKGTKNEKLTSAPLWWDAYITITGAVFGNFSLLVTQGVFK